MKKYTNEKEILEALERQAFLIAQKINTIKPSELKYFQQDIGQTHISLNDIKGFFPVYVDSEVLEKAEITVSKLKKQPLIIAKKHTYPGDFDKGALITQNVIQSNIQQIATFFQRIKMTKNGDYERFFTAVKKSTKNDHLLNLLIPLNVLGIQSNKMMRLLEETDYMRKNYHKFVNLTSREKEVIILLAVGYQNNEIAEQLFISKATVEQHRKNLKRKLEIKRFVDLIRFAQAFDLI